jgi:hypothetical protein
MDGLYLPPGRHMGVNRTRKDSVFSFLSGDPQTLRELSGAL